MPAPGPALSASLEDWQLSTWLGEGGSSEQPQLQIIRGRVWSREAGEQAL